MTFTIDPTEGLKEFVNSILESGFELAKEIKEIQEKLSVISDKIDLTVIADVKSKIGYGLDQLEQYKKKGEKSYLDNFIEEATKGLIQFQTYLSDQNANPGLMNCFAIIVS